MSQIRIEPMTEPVGHEEQKNLEVPAPLTILAVPTALDTPTLLEIIRGMIATQQH